MVLRSSFIAVALLVCGLAQRVAAEEPPYAPKVLVITMFGSEAKPWLDEASFPRKIAVLGLMKAFPDVACSDDGLCMTTTGMGYANAASSIAAIVLSRKLDLTKTYFIISGIAGVDPALGTLGSAHWARFAVDGGCRTRSTPGRFRPTVPRAILRLARTLLARGPNSNMAMRSIA
jgi:purine nucleoside permease